MYVTVERQEQLEKDIEIAKKLQQDLDTQYYDDEVQENQKKTTNKDKKTTGSVTVTKNSMVVFLFIVSFLNSSKECPVCTKQFSASDIYEHIDKCMEASNKKPEEKVGIFARLFGKKEFVFFA